MEMKVTLNPLRALLTAQILEIPENIKQRYINKRVLARVLFFLLSSGFRNVLYKAHRRSYVRLLDTRNNPYTPIKLFALTFLGSFWTVSPNMFIVLNLIGQ